MLRLFRWAWKVLILGSVFGIGYIIGREHSFEEDEDWDSDEEPAAEGDKKEAAAGPAQAEKPVTFQYSSPKATSVSVVGDFNDWNKDKNSMAREGDTWKCSLSLKPGRHEYKFVVNNTDWVTDPKAADSVADKYGGRSSVIEVK